MIDADIRHRAVVHYTHFSRSLRRVARLYNISKSSLQRWVNTAPGSHAIKKRRSRKRLRSDVEQLIRQKVSSNPFTTASDIAQTLQNAFPGLRMSSSTARRCLKRCGLVRKKAFRVVNATTSPEAIRSFCTRYLNSADVVSIDEAGFYVGDHGRYGYSPRGQRLNVPCAKGLRRSKLTLILAVSSSSGVVGYQLMDHNCKKTDFVRFIENLQVAPGSTLVMDNIAFHHSKDTLQAIAAKRCSVVHTLPYSPRCNVIEMVFGALKQEFRRGCPATPTLDFDYRAHLVRILEEWRNKSLRRFFDHTYSWVADVFENLERHDGAAFRGYDTT